MAMVYFTGAATAVAQVDTVTVTGMHSTPASTTFVLTVGIAPNTHAVSVAGDTDAATTAAAIVTAWGADTHPYTQTITAENPSGAIVTLTANPAGAPFTLAASVTPASTAATGVLTLAGNAANTETVVIDSKTYTFQTVLTDVDGNVLIGASASDSIDNLIAAITLGTGAGTTYAASTTLHATVTAAAGAGDTMDATAKIAGTIGNAYTTTETMGSGSWGGGTLSGGEGGSISLVNTTSSDGPNDLGTTDNYSGGALPTNSDDLVIGDTDVNICWGLDALAGIRLKKLLIEKTYTGRIGLDYMAFAQSADGVTTTTTKPEYRQTFMDTAGDADSLLVIGQHEGAGSPTGSDRIILRLKVSGGEKWTTILVKGTAANSADTGRPVVRLSSIGSVAEVGALEIRSAVGGVGLAAEIPGELLHVTDVLVTGSSAATKVICGDEFRVTGEWYQSGGANVLRHIDTVAATGTLTLSANAGDGETVVIDSKTYTWKTTLSDTDGYVQIGATAYESIMNLVAAVNLGTGAGAHYAASTTLHSTVTATGTATTCVVTAKTPGTTGNSITSTETMANGAWGGATLSGGTNGPLASIVVDGGTLTMEGDFGVTALTNGSELGRGGTIYDNHIRTIGNEIETVTLNGGTLDTTGDGRARTYNVVNPNAGKLVADTDVLTINTLNAPSKQFTMSVT